MDNKPVLVSAKVDSRNNTPTLIVEAIETKDSEVSIIIPKDITSDRLKKLKQLLIQNPGNESVILIIENRSIKLPIKVAWAGSLAKKVEATLEENDNYV